MSQIFRIELLPALHGDAILVEYGEQENPSRVLIDSGPISAYDSIQSRLLQVPGAPRKLELFAITHVDADHIEGAIKLLNHAELGLHFQDIWFNSLSHLERGLAPPLATLSAGATRSPMQGEYLMLRIGGWPCNALFQAGAIFAPATGMLPRRVLPGGMVVTLLSPDLEALIELRTRWREALRAAGVSSGDSKIRKQLERKGRYRSPEAICWEGTVVDTANLPNAKLDRSVANRSSIAFLAEFAGKASLFLADAQMRVIEPALGRLLRERGLAQLPLDSIKVSHHGSAGNITRNFLRQVRCTNYLFSTDGSAAEHPSEKTLDLIAELVPQPRLVFNYRADHALRWLAARAAAGRPCEAVLPDQRQAGAVINLLPSAHTGATASPTPKEAVGEIGAPATWIAPAAPS